MSESLLDNDFLRRLEYLHVVTREVFAGQLSAKRLSKKFGMGTEFADHRSYTAGDDLRYINWAAYAQRGDLLIKQFSEEQSTRLYFLVDTSASMTVGTPQKLLFAKKVAAALGYIGLANQDPVTMLSFDGELGPNRTFQGRGQLRLMLQFLEGIPSGRTTAMGQAVRQFAQLFGQAPGVVVLLSDFLDHEGYIEALRLLRYHRLPFMAIRINAREEEEPGMTGDYELEDVETGQRITVPVTPQIVAEYQQAKETHYAELSRLCKVLQRVYLPVVSDTPFEELILDVFRRGGILR